MRNNAIYLWRLSNSKDLSRTTVTVALPLAEDLVLAVEADGGRTAAKPLTILAMDDMEQTARMLRAGLKKFRHVVFEPQKGAHSADERKSLRTFENARGLSYCRVSA